ncbi:CDP-glycerol glycerophosphotransferase family protein [Streptomyces sp. ODS05-4]|uniref:CDP-glycerol glycerophosphotransferase family protein n=1 Tax=Streptomyces sp. ODS05-4 TaxID=2944939 RepID=UPI00210DE7EA|nr:CDP-glycerol glycerophosphotransferase family protein [Streptomyces sp. ODS05-4]
MISTVIRLARVGSRSELAAAALMGLGYPSILAAALIPNLWLFAAAAAVTYATDWYLHQKSSYLVNRLGAVRLGLPIRFLLRELLLILLLAREGLADHPLFYAAAGCLLLFYGLQAAQGALATLVRLRRTMPVVTRNIDLHAVRVPDAPPRTLLHRSGEKMLHADVLMLAGLLTAVLSGRDVYGYAGVAGTLALGLLYILALAPYLRGRHRVPAAGAVLKAVTRWLGEYQPTVALYFSGGKDSAYQLNMWLETLEHLDGRPIIIMRERNLVERLHQTTVPVLCVPGGQHLMAMDLSTIRVTLYPANVGKNIHMLREPSMKHVFIGHGDSDKLASVNPYSKVYDEVWTAGRAGRDRYALAEVGVRDEDIVEVGRPQLAPIAADAPKHPVPTILYAPTWEGWDHKAGNTSLLLAGENIVRRLLDADRPVRVVYKPHPFTGLVNGKAKAVDARIRKMIAAASAARAADPRWAGQAAETAGQRSAARAELTRIEARLAELTDTGRPGSDEAETSRTSLADPHRLAEVRRLRAERADAHWRSLGWWEHTVVTGSAPSLYDCFNEADAMVSDISSVVSDFITSGKPYAVTDSAEVGAEEFKRQNTAVRAAVILSNSAAELDELLDAVADPAADRLAGARRELKRYLLGADRPTSQERFNAAVHALAAKAEARNARVARKLDGAEIAQLDGEADGVVEPPEATLDSVAEQGAGEAEPDAPAATGPSAVDPAAVEATDADPAIADAAAVAGATAEAAAPTTSAAAS